jgi:hypothetical protein
MQMWLSGQLQNPVGVDNINMADITMYGGKVKLTMMMKMLTNAQFLPI